MGRFRVPSASYEEIGGSAGQAATPGSSSSRARVPPPREPYISIDLSDDEEDEEEISRSLKGKERAGSVGPAARTARKNKDKGKTAALPQKKSVEDEIRDQARRKAKRDKLKKTIKLNSQKYIYVGNLSPDVTDLMLEEIFSSFGTVRSVTVRSAGGYPSASQPDSRSRHHKYESRIYASVEFKNSVSVYRALQMNGEELCGQKLAIVRDALDLPEFSTMINEYIAPPSGPVPAQQAQPSGSSRQSASLPRGSRAATEVAETIPQARPSTVADRTSPSRLQPEHTNARIAYQFRPRVNADQQNTNTSSPISAIRCILL